MYVANSIMIYPQYRRCFTDGQIQSWRIDSLTNLGIYKKYSFEQIDNFMDVEIDNNLSKMVQLNFIKEQLVFGNVLPNQIVFVSVDSNIVCKYNILDEISKIRDSVKTKFYIENAKIIFIDTFISRIENNYKLIKNHQYPGINLEYVENYIKFVDNQSMFFDENAVDYIHNVNMLHACNILNNEEIKYFSNNGEVHCARQEINDNAQLEILLQFRDSIPESKMVFLTLDKGLQLKCVDNNVVYSLM